jgi:hypothetical protein
VRRSGQWRRAARFLSRGLMFFTSAGELMKRDLPYSATVSALCVAMQL